jgi:predicted nucleic acid-binding protein
MIVFADTYYFVALVNLKGDKARQRAIDTTLRRTGKLVTTTYVLTELANMLSEPRHRRIFLDVLAALRSDPTTVIVEDEPGLFHEGVDYFAARPDKGWSLTGCISFIIMTRESIADALTADHHFEQAGFRALLKDP